MRKSLPPNRERILKTRLRQLTESPTLETLRSQPGNCHELTQDRAGQLAVSLDGLFRLIFEPIEPIPRKPDGGLDWNEVVAVEIIEGNLEEFKKRAGTCGPGLENKRFLGGVFL